MDNVLPDSRLRETKRTVFIDIDWEECKLDGTVINHRDRVEFEPIFCISCCTKECGYVPVGLVSFASWLCLNCSAKYGVEASQSETSDREFWRKVNDAVVRRFGRSLTGEELDRLAEHGKLGRELELLERESPYRKMAR